MELIRISLTRDQTQVFADLSLNLAQQRIGLIGPNGSGKSSLLRLVKGLIAPSSGQVLAPGPIGFVFQNPDHQLLFPTVMEELCFGLLEQGVAQQQAEEKALALLAQHDMLHLQDKTTQSLSDGQKQLLCIFSVLADGAQALLLDEPCASLDRATTRRIMAVIQSLPQQVVMATHDLSLLVNFDRVIWLQEGAVQMDGPPTQVIQAYQNYTDRSYADISYADQIKSNHVPLEKDPVDQNCAVPANKVEFQTDQGRST